MLHLVCAAAFATPGRDYLAALMAETLHATASLRAKNGRHGNPTTVSALLQQNMHLRLRFYLLLGPG